MAVRSVVTSGGVCGGVLEGRLIRREATGLSVLMKMLRTFVTVIYLAPQICEIYCKQVISQSWFLQACVLSRFSKMDILFLKGKKGHPASFHTSCRII